MRLIKPSIEVLPIGVDIFKRIETIGRVCVRSEDKITDESAMKFCRDRLKSGHTAIFNHGIAYLKYDKVIDGKYLFRLLAEFPHIKFGRTPASIYLAISMRCYLDYRSAITDDRFKFIDSTDEDVYNYFKLSIFIRSPFLDIDVEEDMPIVRDYFYNITEEECMIECPSIVHISVKFTTDRGITHELVRHTAAAFMQESTRWCNYSGNKFGNEITYIKPFWVEEVPMNETDDDTMFKQATRRIEQWYLAFIKHGWTAQQARSILPNTLKSDIWVTATLKEWYGATINCKVGDISYEERKGLFPQRTHKTAHPQMIEVMDMVKIELDKLGYGN